MKTRFESGAYIAGTSDVVYAALGEIVIVALVWRYTHWWIALPLGIGWIYGLVLLARAWQRTSGKR